MTLHYFCFSYISFIRVGTSLTLDDEMINRQMQHLADYVSLQKRGTQGGVLRETRHKRSVPHEMKIIKMKLK